MNSAELKKLVGTTVVDQEVKSGMRLGMGTGSTALWAMRRIAELLADGTLKDLYIVPTSFQTKIELETLGFKTCSLNDPEVDGRIDLAIDGADEVDPDFRLIKGGGAAHTQEKLVEYQAERYVIIVDESKLVENLGLNFLLPLEVIPEARRVVTQKLQALGAQVELRAAAKKAGPVITDNGNLILDARFPQGIAQTMNMPLPQCEALLRSFVGVLEIGLFTRQVDAVYVGRAQGGVDVLTPREQRG
ncbi:ribose 5-phosphate isomerase A [Spirochaeta lutea]|uniref:Ribose-5-phosphate isomerase A n=1 Tax=Spirochaeta lutea TaxID=1480694 RepID=A0A098R0Q6_9SPIO|nr:ribose 5-phosphate isomerase A [Spirochaeta lutea]KGE73301.1 hypothetical protein DC28_04660 [Spirochaeta lutea]